MKKEKKIQQRENMQKPHRTRAPDLSGLQPTLFCTHTTAPLMKFMLINRLLADKDGCLKFALG